MSQKTILAILAHPDDESFGPGGTLARYAAEGVDVHVCITTDGAAGSVEIGQEAAHSNLIGVRTAELENACQILGATPHWLGYRDSGMSGNAANQHPEAFVQSDDQEAIGRVVKLIRQLKPDVVITHDETGGYYHPDHIRCWAIVTEAFHAAADPSQFAHFALGSHQAERLYYTAFSNRGTALLSAFIRLRGGNPKRFGRNEDIDITRLGIPVGKLHTRIDYQHYWQKKVDASAAHISQGGNDGSPLYLIPDFISRRWLAVDTFIRAYPVTADGFREQSLFPSS